MANWVGGALDWASGKMFTFSDRIVFIKSFQSRTQQYFNLSPDQSVRGPWNQGEMPNMGKSWEYVEDPLNYVNETEGLTDLEDSMEGELEEMDRLNEKMSAMRTKEVKAAEPEGIAAWSDYYAVEV